MIQHEPLKNSDPSPTPRSMSLKQQDLLSYPRPSVAADVVLLTISEGLLNVVLHRREKGTHAGVSMLPGTMLREHERLSDAMTRILDTRMCIQGLVPRQLQVFDDPDRDERGWVLTVTHLGVLPVKDLSLALEHGHIQLRPVDQDYGLPFSHDKIIAWAVSVVRSEYEQEPDPWNLLEEEFTMTQLRQVHEAIAGTSYQKDTFRRTMLPRLETLDARTTPPGSRGLGRPARLYRKRSEDRGSKNPLSDH